MALKPSPDDPEYRDWADLEGDIQRDERPEPFMPYNEAANGGRWWEDDLKEAAQDLYGEPTIEN